MATAEEPEFVEWYSSKDSAVWLANPPKVYCWKCWEFFGMVTAGESICDQHQNRSING